MPKKRQLVYVRMEHCGGPPVCAARLQNSWSMRRTRVPSVKVGVLYTCVCQLFAGWSASVIACYLQQWLQSKAGKAKQIHKDEGKWGSKEKKVSKDRRQKS